MLYTTVLTPTHIERDRIQDQVLETGQFVRPDLGFSALGRNHAYCTPSYDNKGSISSKGSL